MPMHLQHEIESLKKQILSLSAIVEENVKRAVSSLTKRDYGLAKEVVEKDIEIDRFEVELEEDCLKILALHQPVAIDLRFIIAVLKINNDLERIGDEAVNIAERTAYLATRKDFRSEISFDEMTDKVQFMLKKSLDALVQLDANMARDVCALDDEVDDMNYEIFERVKGILKKKPQNLDTLIHIFGISRHLERIADHATNIAEDVIYMIEGIITRHKIEDYTLRSGQDSESK
jgi:phosphate transport system protein